MVIVRRNTMLWSEQCIIIIIIIKIVMVLIITLTTIDLDLAMMNVDIVEKSLARVWGVGHAQVGQAVVSAMHSNCNLIVVSLIWHHLLLQSTYEMQYFKPDQVEDFIKGLTICFMIKLGVPPQRITNTNANTKKCVWHLCHL